MEPASAESPSSVVGVLVVVVVALVVDFYSLPLIPHNIP
jgi:hypothetical protein